VSGSGADPPPPPPPPRAPRFFDDATGVPSVNAMCSTLPFSPAAIFSAAAAAAEVSLPSRPAMPGTGRALPLLDGVLPLSIPAAAMAEGFAGVAGGVIVAAANASCVAGAGSACIASFNAATSSAFFAVFFSSPAGHPRALSAARSLATVSFSGAASAAATPSGAQ